MRIKTTNTKNGRLFYIIKTYYDTHGKEHSITVEKLGNENDIRSKYNCDPDEWAKAHVAKLNEQERLAKADIEISFSPKSLISKNHQYSFNIGYLFLQSLYCQLSLDKMCSSISKKYKFDFDLDCILSRLIYGRILQPSSKTATCKFAKTLLEQPKFDNHQVYRALDVIADETDFIQETIYSNSFELGKRHCGVIYYDCTNFFFEIEEADENGLRQYGKSKENRALPIVEMGMFIDSDGIPLAMCIHPGNTNEQVTLKPLEEKIISDFNMSKFVVCTDAGLASKANRKFNDKLDRAFIVTQPIKKLKADIKEWALDKSRGWRVFGDKRNKAYSIENLNLEENLDTIFYKEIWVDQGNFEEKLIVTFSPKYCLYQRHIRNSQIDRAQCLIENGAAKVSKKNQNDFRRFIDKISSTNDGEIADRHKYILNTDRIIEEEKYDGFYAVVTNLDEDPCEIIKVNKQRWRIEECFRIMKTEFKSRPVYVQKDNRIEAHFITCYIALILYRYLEKRLDNKFTCEEILETLQNMNVREIVGEGFVPAYTRTELTDALHEIFGFRTDYQFLSKDEIKKILKISKKKPRYAKKS